MNPRVVVAIGLLLTVAFVPANGNVSFFSFLDKTFARLQTPVTEQEQGELNFLSCVAEVGSVIPDRTDVVLVGNPDSYLRQRAQDLLYPRVRLVNENAGYSFHIGNDPAPAGEVLKQVDCGGVVFTVVKNG